MNQSLPPLVKKITIIAVLLLIALGAVVGIVNSQGAGFGIDGLTLVVFGPFVIGLIFFFGIALLAARSYHANSQLAQPQHRRSISSRLAAVLLTVILLVVALGIVWILNLQPVGP